ncbi:MAG: molybdopterin-synthase adenylyltransferase MoeB [Flavobacteriales bacterium]|nr:molybdopterin-synthase adenylyltransferase MoeB [Flavobacteriales bacterium]MCB9172988.1 molybdopterin-synthase adenylyltransferase MoeB [Flavobacteriales bacterium]
MLDDKEKYRYSRHLLLDKVGELGQQKLKAAKVLVIGAGGLGCPVLQYLTAAGVGTIGIIDFDKVDETNLQRQILFSINDIGKNKAIAAKERLEQLNQFVKFEVNVEKLTSKNALSIFNNYDVVVDGTDNFSTRYLVNDACVIKQKPLVYGAIYKFEGQVSVFNYQNGPSYRCLFPEPPKPGSVPSCSDVGVIGVLPGIIGTQQANEALKIILEIGTPLSGKLLMYDALQSSFTTLKVNRSEEQITKVLNSKNEFENNDYDLFCGIKPAGLKGEITSSELKKILENEALQLLDVREEWEQPKIEHFEVLNIPLNQIPVSLAQIDKTKKTVVICQHGVRSLKAIEFLKANGFNNLINLTGGMATY